MTSSTHRSGSPPTTSELLEGITDAAQFQSLAIGVLWRSERRCAHLVEVGANARGETIVGALDAFAMIPNSDPPHFVAVEVTKTGLRALRAKWLAKRCAGTEKGRKGSSPTATEGDLIKAGRQAEVLRRKFPSARFTLFLVTNRRLDTDLHTEVLAEASRLHIDVIPWDQSLLARYLDLDSEGQWLKQLYLGVDAERLSGSLLHDLCRKSAESYLRFLTDMPESILCSRTVDSEVNELVAHRRCRAICLLADSGQGKSIVAFKALKAAIERGHFGLWIPAEAVREGRPLTDAIENTLRELHPSIEKGAGRVAIEIANSDAPLLLIVDDIARTASPARTLALATRWAAPPARGPAGEAKQEHDVTMLIPTWPNFVHAAIPSPTRFDWLAHVTVGAMSEDECICSIRNAAKLADRRMSEAEAASVVRQIGCDPFIVGLYIGIMNASRDEWLPTDGGHPADRVLEAFLRHQIAELVSDPGVVQIHSEYDALLAAVARWMLRTHKLVPSWRELQRAFGETSPDASGLRLLVKHRKIARCADGDESQFVFRHDRIRDALLVREMVRDIEEGVPLPEYFTDPYFAELAGRAISRAATPEGFLRELAQAAPVVLFAAVREAPDDACTQTVAIRALAIEWLKKNRHQIPSSVRDYVGWLLLETDSSFVQEALDITKFGFLGMLAALRNGVADGGIHYLVSHTADHMTLSAAGNDWLRDRIVAHARIRHEKKIAARTRMLLQSSATPQWAIRGALSLTALMKLPLSHEDYRGVLESGRDQTELLPDFLLAVMSCYDSSLVDVLQQALIRLDGLPIRSSGSQAMELRERIVRDLGWCMRKGASSELVACLIQVVKETDSDSLRSDLLDLIISVDDPDAAAFIASRACEDKNSARLWIHQRERQGTLGTLVGAVRGRLLLIWTNESILPAVREAAFRMWACESARGDLAALQHAYDCELFRPLALARRADLADHTVAADFCVALARGTVSFSLASHIWSDEVRAAVDRELESISSAIMADSAAAFRMSYLPIDTLLWYIPVPDLERLLSSHWAGLERSDWFVQTALRRGTPGCLRLFRSSMKTRADVTGVLRHMGTRLWLPMDGAGKAPIESFVALEPYLVQMEPQDLELMAYGCCQLGGEYAKWGRRKLTPFLDEQARAKSFSDRGDIAAELDEFAARAATEEDNLWHWNVGRYAESLLSSDISLDALVEVVLEWLGNEPTMHKVQIAVACGQVVGKRRHLCLFESVLVGHDDVKARMWHDLSFAIRCRSLD